MAGRSGGKSKQMMSLVPGRLLRFLEPLSSSRTAGTCPRRISIMDKLISTRRRRIQKRLDQKAGLSVGRRARENQLRGSWGGGVSACYLEQHWFPADRTAARRGRGNMET